MPSARTARNGHFVLRAPLVAQQGLAVNAPRISALTAHGARS